MGKGMHTCMISMDLQKAFNTLDHKILVEKMACLGFKTSVIKWFGSYLSSRKLFVSVDGIFSKTGTLNDGVPQGSILGRLLFWCMLTILPNYYQKVILTVVVMIRVFSIKKKTFPKL